MEFGILKAGQNMAIEGASLDINTLRNKRKIEDLDYSVKSQNQKIGNPTMAVDDVFEAENENHEIPATKKLTKVSQGSKAGSFDDAAKDIFLKNPMHSFIYNTDDNTTIAAFTTEENAEIDSTNVKDMPDFYDADDGLFSQFFKKFAEISTLDGLRDALFGYAHPELLQVGDSKYWMCRVFYCFLNDIWPCRTGAERFGQDNSWDGGHSLPFYWSKGDGYVRVLGASTRDIAAIEAGPKWEGIGGTKSLIECGKIMPKVLRDIFWSTHARLCNSHVALERLVIPGLAIYGDKCKRISLDYVGG
ncbi:hypothetical protein HK100_002711, partial [Physocladia obscura]